MLGLSISPTVSITLLWTLCSPHNNLNLQAHFTHHQLLSSLLFGLTSPKMPLPATKRQKREDYRKAHQETPSAELPKKKFYRQRAHANPFSDHHLT